MQKFLIRSLFLILLLSAAESWALPECKMGFWGGGIKYHNCQGTYTFAEGQVEEGIWENGEFLYAQKTKYGDSQFASDTAPSVSVAEHPCVLDCEKFYIR
jgi:hypothetical protein